MSTRAASQRWPLRVPCPAPTRGPSPLTMQGAALLLALLAGCNRGSLPALTGDAGDEADLSEAAAFCGSRSSPRLQLNASVAEHPATSARALALNCCEAAVVDFVSAQVEQPVSFAWFVPGGQFPSGSKTVDLAQLPSGWRVALTSGCSFGEPGCTSTDAVDGGLTGSLTVSSDGGGRYVTTACVSFREAPGSPHKVIHSLDLWTPPITTP